MFANEAPTDHDQVSRHLSISKSFVYLSIFLYMQGKSWAWFGFFGSLMLLMGGLANLVKVLKMQDGIQLEKLRGGAQDRLVQEREGRVPLVL